MRRWFLCFLVLLFLGFGFWRLRAPSATRWQTVAPGVEMRTLSVPSGSALGGDAEVVALRVSVSRVKVAQGSALDTSQWRKNRKALAVMNGGFFDPAGKSLGLRITDGKKRNSLHEANWGVFYIRKGRDGVLHPRILHTRDFKREFTSLRRITQAVQCGPRLVVNGKTTDLKPQTARRTGIGITRDDKIILAVCDGALAFDDWAKLWSQATGLDCRDALNLDGGGSTQLSLQIGGKTREVTGAWPVPDVILVQ